MNTTFESLLKPKLALDREVAEAGRALQAFPRDAMGLTLDSVKATPEWKSARALYDKLSSQSRKFNSAFLKLHKKEWREYLQANR